MSCSQRYLKTRNSSFVKGFEKWHVKQIPHDWVTINHSTFLNKNRDMLHSGIIMLFLLLHKFTQISGPFKKCYNLTETTVKYWNLIWNGTLLIWINTELNALWHILMFTVYFTHRALNFLKYESVCHYSQVSTCICSLGQNFPPSCGWIQPERTPDFQSSATGEQSICTQSWV